MRAWVLLILAIGFYSPAQAADSSSVGVLAQDMVTNRDYLGFRVFAKRVLTRKPVDRTAALALKYVLLLNGDKVGFDLIYVWNQAANLWQSNTDKQLEQADAYLLSSRFKEAFAAYQVTARYIKRSLAVERNPERRAELETLYPFVLESMGRALYGAGRYRDALVTLSWINPTFPRYRQVLFERMWTAFRLGRVDLALGAIASQRSAYFSAFMHSESYLLQNYIYRKLCRHDELKPLTLEMKKYEVALNRDDLESWATTDLETRTLWKLTQAPVDIKNEFVSAAEKEGERIKIKRQLENSFKSQKPKIVADLKNAMAFVNLADGSGTSSLLQPVEKLPSRKALLDLNLEIWPADSQEEWIDEIGTHRFLGESLCAAKSKL